METKVNKASNIISNKNARIIPVPRRSHHKKITNVMTNQAPTGKPATIFYKKLPNDMILITGFENFLSLEEIFDKYGKVIAKTYFDFPYHMAGMTGALYLVGLNTTPTIVGKVLSKDDFSKLVTHVKKCGGLLHDIIQACDKGEVKRIEI
jgi:hypothetical protein